MVVARARDSSMSRMARVASKPFMMGMLMSVGVGGGVVSTGVRGVGGYWLKEEGEGEGGQSYP